MLINILSVLIYTVIIGVSMNEKKKPTVTIEELALSNMYQLEVIVCLLDRKGLISKEEILD